jgi:uncharacterized protein (TIGR02996 family)
MALAGKEHEQMETKQALLRAINDDPDDDLPRLAYADYLEEHGGAKDLARAELIRAQVVLARLGEGDGQAGALRQRERELLAAHGPAWRAALPTLPGITWGKFERGFVSCVEACNATSFCDSADNIFEAAPVQSVLLRGIRGADRFGAVRGLTQVRVLEVSGCKVSAVNLARLLGPPQFGRLLALRLRQCRLAADAAAVLAAAPSLQHLSELYIVACPYVGPAVAAALASSSGPRGLRALDLAVTDLGDEGARAVASSPLLGNLRDLDLSHNRLTTAGVEALALSPHLRGLARLRLASSRLNLSAVRALTARPGALRHLDLRGCRICATGHRLLLKRFGDSVLLGPLPGANEAWRLWYSYGGAVR